MCFYNLIVDVPDLVVVYAWPCPIILWMPWYHNILCTTYRQLVFPILPNTITILCCVCLPQHLASKKTATSSKSVAAASKKSTTTKASTTTGGSSGGKAKSAGGGGGGGKQKRSPWDLKGRLQDMEVLMADERKFSSNTIGDLQTQVCICMIVTCSFSIYTVYVCVKWHPSQLSCMQ